MNRDVGGDPINARFGYCASPIGTHVIGTLLADDHQRRGPRGPIRVEKRVGNIAAGATFHVEVDGVERTGRIAAPNTGASDASQTVARTGIPLTAGSHVVRTHIPIHGHADRDACRATGRTSSAAIVSGLT
jgi:hypothetical protein